MAQPVGPSRLARLSELPLARIIAYYVLLVAGGVLLARLFPALGRSFSGERIGDLVRLGGGHADLAGLPEPRNTLSVAVARAEGRTGVYLRGGLAY